jgi:hypothetical protein
VGQYVCLVLLGVGLLVKALPVLGVHVLEEKMANYEMTARRHQPAGVEVGVAAAAAAKTVTINEAASMATAFWIACI